MFNSFEQAHNQYLEPIETTEPEVVAYDWGGFPIYEGDGEYWVTPDDRYVSVDDVDSYMANMCGTIEF